MLEESIIASLMADRVEKSTSSCKEEEVDASGLQVNDQADDLGDVRLSLQPFGLVKAYNGPIIGLYLSISCVRLVREV